MPPLTYQRLVDLARAADGETLQTVTGKPFTVRIHGGDELVFTPASSGYGQADGRPPVRRFVERYNATGSLRPRDYADVTRNGSYLVGLLRWAREAGLEP